MTDFNNLPLDEKKKQAQAGDIVVTDSGARVTYATRDTDAVSSGIWVKISNAVDTWIKLEDVTDIIRPTARKVPEVPEVVEWLRYQSSNLIDMRVFDARVFASLLCQKLADHFEKETP